MARISPRMNVIIRKDKTKMDLAKYHHVSLFSPVHSTLERAIKSSHLTSWPGLTTKLIVKKLPAVLATSKGHLRQKKQNLQSTKIKSTYDKEINKINQK